MRKLQRSLTTAITVILIATIFNFPQPGEATKAYAAGSNNERVLSDYTTDFNEATLKELVDKAQLNWVDEKNVTLTDGKLVQKSNSANTRFGGIYRLGDDYGIGSGVGSVDISNTLDTSKFSIGTRLTKIMGNITDTGIWFNISANSIEIKEPTSRTKAQYAINLDITKERKYTVEDNNTKITLFATADDGSKLTLAVVNYTSDKLEFYDNVGNLVAESDVKHYVGPSGYFKVALNRFAGTIDNYSYQHYDINTTASEGAERIVSYSNWVATDDLNRTSLTNTDVKDPKIKKAVGIFYFISQDSKDGPIYNITGDYNTGGLDKVWKGLNSGEIGYGRYWAEPYFGYYQNDDAWIQRKHAYQLVAAGVDFVFLDTSNNLTYPEAYTSLFETWSQIRKEGGKTPQICFFTGDNAHTLVIDLYDVNKNIYAESKYEDLWYKVDGKPLILGNTTEPTTDNIAILKNQSNKEIYKWYQNGGYKETIDKFTVRRSWAWSKDNGFWPWLMEYPQVPGRSMDGTVEQMSVALGHHASTSKGRSYINNKIDFGNKTDFQFTSTTSGLGLCFAQQFGEALKIDPSVIIITGWNEWTAGKWNAESKDKSKNITASVMTPDFTMVDLFNTEFSRDAEAMKTRGVDGQAGFGDNYYYQMVNFIRQYKGLDEMPSASGQDDINIQNGAKQWENVGPEFRDTIGDTVYRSHASYGGIYQYVNTTGRNDIDNAKVSLTKDSIYFNVTTTKSITSPEGENWMNLYIDVDQTRSTGWEGYDYVINRSRTDSKVTIEKFVNNSWNFETIGDADYTLIDKQLVIKVPASMLNISDTKNFDFKWADNSTTTGNVMEFIDLGDSAPNDRFNFRYISKGGFLNIQNLPFDLELPIFIILVSSIVITSGFVVAIVITLKKRKATK